MQRTHATASNFTRPGSVGFELLSRSQQPANHEVVLMPLSSSVGNSLCTCTTAQWQAELKAVTCALCKDVGMRPSLGTRWSQGTQSRPAHTRTHLCRLLNLPCCQPQAAQSRQTRQQSFTGGPTPAPHELADIKTMGVRV